MTIAKKADTSLDFVQDIDLSRKLAIKAGFDISASEKEINDDQVETALAYEVLVGLANKKITKRPIEDFGKEMGFELDD